jgi:hypothetical protein
VRPLKIVLKNCFISPRSKEPTCSHEDSLPSILGSTHSLLVEVVKNPFPTIKREKVSNIIRWNKPNPNPNYITQSRKTWRVTITINILTSIVSI